MFKKNINLQPRFIGPIIITFVLFLYGLIFSILSLNPTSFSTDQIPILPGLTGTDMMFLSFFPFFIFILIYFIGKIISIYIIDVHKGLKLKRYDYFIVPQDKHITGWKLIYRSFIPGLLAVNIGILIAYNGTINIFFYNSDPTGLDYLPVAIEITTVLIGLPIASLIYTPLWIIESSGLMCSLNQKKYRNRKSPDIECVSRIFTSFIKNITGISTLLTYSVILITFLQQKNELGSYLIVFIDPFAIIAFFIPLSAFFEYKVKSIKDYLIPKLEKKGIDVSLKEIKIEKI